MGTVNYEQFKKDPLSVIGEVSTKRDAAALEEEYAKKRFKKLGLLEYYWGEKAGNKEEIIEKYLFAPFHILISLTQRLTEKLKAIKAERDYKKVMKWTAEEAALINKEYDELVVESKAIIEGQVDLSKKTAVLVAKARTLALKLGIPESEIDNFIKKFANAKPETNKREDKVITNKQAGLSEKL